MIDSWIQDTDFRMLYDAESSLFSIGFNVETNKLTDSYYDLLASEARQASLIAIAKKDVTAKHWNSLNRTLTILGKYKGLISWAGTAFEYLMPNLNIKKYPGSLLDESGKFMIKSQREYAKKLGIPWGISESAFNLKDLNNNYQYKAFGIPWLGLKRGLADEMVVAPYGSILAICDFPKEVVQNMKELEKQNMLGIYGFYEAIDYTPTRLPYGKAYANVKTYMAHHQGLILLSIVNLFCHNKLQERFHRNPQIEAVSILLQEKMPEDMILTKEKKEKVEKIRYTSEATYAERVYTKFNSNLPISNVLANENYTIVLDEKGQGYSMYEGNYINRYKPTSDLPEGIFFYLKNIRNNRIWTSGNISYSGKPDQYSVKFEPDKSQYNRMDGSIETNLKITTGLEEPVEIRTLEITNHGIQEETLEITSYFEPVLSSKESDYSHMAFNNLFLTYDYDEDINSIIVTRKNREQQQKQYYLATTCYTEKSTMGELEYEIDKESFLGRGNYQLPEKVVQSKPFSKKLGLVLDPIVAMKRTIKIMPEETVSVHFLLAVGTTKEEVVNHIEKYQNSEKIVQTFELEKAKAEEEIRYLGLTGDKIEGYQKLITYLLFQNPLKSLYLSKLPKKRYKQSELWKYGISGDLPILLVRMEDVNDRYVVEDILKAFEFMHIQNIKIDLVILDGEKYSYESYVREAIENAILNTHQAYLKNVPGGIFVLSEAEMPKEDRDLLDFCANLKLDCRKGLASNQLQELEEEYLEKQKVLPEEKLSSMYQDEQTIERTMSIYDPDELIYNNEYGGFSKDGKSYHMKVSKEEKLPTVWSHVMANPDFGTVVTETMGGYTWSKNSRLNRITAWSNNQVTDVPSEIIYLKDRENGKKWSVGASPMADEQDYYITYGFGYSVYTHVSDGIVQEVTSFVPRKDKVKVQIIKLKNTNPFRKKLKLVYYVKPVLGEDEMKTNGYLSVRREDANNMLLVENHYETEVAKELMYLSSSEWIHSYTGSKDSFIGKGSIANPEGLDKLSLDNESGLRNKICYGYGTRN